MYYLIRYYLFERKIIFQIKSQILSNSIASTPLIASEIQIENVASHIQAEHTYIYIYT